jgi:hypothetical protein
MDLLGTYGSESDGDIDEAVVQITSTAEASKPNSFQSSQSTSGVEARTLPVELPPPKNDAGTGMSSSLLPAYSVQSRGNNARSCFSTGFGMLPELGGTKSADAGKLTLGLSNRRKVVKLQTMKPLAAESDEVRILFLMLNYVEHAIC